MAKEKAVREPLFHVIKRDDLSSGKAWLIRIVTIVISFLLVGLLSSFVTGKDFGSIYGTMFQGVFGRLFNGNFTMLWKYLQ